MPLKKKLNEVLKNNGIKPNKKLGQNFIFDFNVLDKIVKSVLPINKSTVIEIGPGPGGLSRAILKYKPKELILIEIDKKFRPVLEEVSNDFLEDNIKVIYKDFLKIDYEKLSSNKIKLFSNLPYYISTKILLKILPLKETTSEVVFTFQKEVGLRLLAKPNSKDYSRLTVITQFSCNVKKMYILPANIFYPTPKIDSIVIKLTPKNNVNKDIFNMLQTVTKLAFGKRRKILKNSLSKINHINALLEKIGVNKNSRAEDVSVEQYVKLSEELLSHKSSISLTKSFSPV